MAHTTKVFIINTCSKQVLKNIWLLVECLNLIKFLVCSVNKVQIFRNMEYCDLTNCFNIESNF